MVHILRPRPWSRRASDMPPIVDERVWRERRAVLKALGLGGLMAAAASSFERLLGQDGASPPRSAPAPGGAPSLHSYPSSTRWVPPWEPAGGASLYPAQRNALYTGGRPLISEDVAATNNNFYEFLPGHAGPAYKQVAQFEARPWTVHIGGEVEEPRAVDLDDVAKIAPLEERIYRFRCVERWSMVVPWTGLSLAAFVRWCKPKPSARYVRFVSFLRPEQAPGQREAKQYPWPYYEGLRMDEALNPLALLVTGIFGHGLPAQHGAPLRVIVPWKYGYKSPKSFVKVEFTREEPHTFWCDLQPQEYPFESNVDPRRPHPRWSQEVEWDVGTNDKRPTQVFNGYGEQVASLYAKGPQDEQPPKAPVQPPKKS